MGNSSKGKAFTKSGKDETAGLGESTKGTKKGIGSGTTNINNGQGEVEIGEREEPINVGDNTEQIKTKEGGKVLIELLDFGQIDEDTDYEAYINNRDATASEVIESEDIPETLKDAVDEYFKEISN